MIIVDNSSSDDSLQMIDSFKSSHPLSNINVIPLQTNTGYASAISLAASKAHGKLVFATNNDVEFTENFFETLIAEFEIARQADPEIVAAAGRYLYSHCHNLVNSAGSSLAIIGGFYRGYGLKDSHLFQKREYIGFPTGAGALIDRKFFLEHGGYDSIYFSGGEESDFGWTIWNSGKRAIYIPQAIMFHMESFTFGEKGIFGPRKFQLMISGHLLAAFKIYDARYLLQFAIITAITYPLACIYLINRTRNPAYLLSFVKAAQDLRTKLSIVKKRRTNVRITRKFDQRATVSLLNELTTVGYMGPKLAIRELVGRYLRSSSTINDAGYP
jgi:GT2 family glycosyltransferase